MIPLKKPTTRYKNFFFMKVKAQAPSNKLRQIVAGQFGKLTKPQASSNKLRQNVKCFIPGRRVKNRFRRNI